MTELRTRAAPPQPQSLAGWLRQQPLLALLPLRAFLGVTFTWAGLQKLADPAFFKAGNPTSLQGQLALVRHTSPLSFMLGVVADHAVIIGVVIAVAELAVGVGTLLGLWSRLAALGGALLALSFYLTISWRTHPYYYGADIVFLFAWTPILLLGSPLLSLDAWRQGRGQLDGRPRPPTAAPPRPLQQPVAAGVRRPPPVAAADIDPERRAVLATGAVGALVVVAAGVDAAVGRMGGGRTPSGTLSGVQGSAQPSASASSSAPPSAAGPTPSGTPQHAVDGTVLGSASSIPVGGAATFTDPSTGAPAYVVQPAAGSFRAFSAICTHAGCTVSFARDAEQFVCPCHGGVYSAKTGQVLAGPPPAPLQQIPIKVVGGKVVLPKGH